MLAGAGNPIGHLRVNEATQWLSEQSRPALGFSDAKMASYIAIAHYLGLRVYVPLVLRERALFIARFDRRVTAGAVIPLAQESIAAMLGAPGFNATSRHDEAVLRLMQVASDPQQEMLEYIERDMAYLVFGNRDNHARNTALQRDFDGQVCLTLLFDFAPMWLHPDGIARSRWSGNDGGAPAWSRVLDSVVAGSNQKKHAPNVPLNFPPNLPLNRAALVAGLPAMMQALADIVLHGFPAELGIGVLACITPHCHLFDKQALAPTIFGQFGFVQLGRFQRDNKFVFKELFFGILPISRHWHSLRF